MAVSRFRFRLAFSDWDLRGCKGWDEGEDEEEEDEVEEGGEHSLRLQAVRHTPDPGLKHLAQVDLHMTYRNREGEKQTSAGIFFKHYIIYKTFVSNNPQ